MKGLGLTLNSLFTYHKDESLATRPL